MSQLKNSCGPDDQALDYTFFKHSLLLLNRDEDGLEKDPVMYDKLLPLKEAIVDGLSGPAQRFHERQFDFFKKITAVSGQIKDFPKGPLRKNACSKALQVCYTGPWRIY